MNQKRSAIEGRKLINDALGSVMMIEVQGERFAFPECWNCAEIGNGHANITDYVLKTLDGRYIRLTVVDEAAMPSAHGVFKGWYTAYFIDGKQASKVRESWAVLREQPGEPRGPWA